MEKQRETARQKEKQREAAHQLEKKQREAALEVAFMEATVINEAVLLKAIEAAFLEAMAESLQMGYFEADKGS